MTSRDRSIVAVMVLVVLAGAGYFVLVKPKHHQASQLQNQIASTRNALTQAEAEVQAGLLAESRYKTYVGQLNGIRTAVPSDDQIPELINELQKTSTRSKVSFQAVSVAGAATSTSGAPATSTTFPSQGFNLTFVGSYFSVTRLLGSLAAYVRADDKHFQASGRLISISTLSLTPGGSGTSASQTDSGDVTAAVTATDYDVPATLLPAGASTPTSTASPAANVTPSS